MTAKRLHEALANINQMLTPLVREGDMSQVSDLLPEQRVAPGVRWGLRAAVIVASFTLLSALRHRLVAASLATCGFLAALSVGCATVAVYERTRPIIDVGLAATSLVGMVTACAATLIFFAGDFTAQTAYVTLVRPMSRWSFVVGKFLGLWSMLCLLTAGMGLITASTVVAWGGVLPSAFHACIVLDAVAAGITIGIAQLMACLASPSVATAYTAAVLVAGLLAGDMQALAAQQPTAWARQLMTGLSYVLPDLSALSLRGYAANNLPVPPGFVAHACAYGGCYTAILVGLSSLALHRRRAL